MLFSSHAVIITGCLSIAEVVGVELLEDGTGAATVRSAAWLPIREGCKLQWLVVPHIHPH